MRNGAVKNWNLEELLLRIFNSLGDCLWNFLRLAVADADCSLLIANNDESCEGETTSALNNLRYAVDEDNALCVWALLFLWCTVTTIAAWTTVI